MYNCILNLVKLILSRFNIIVAVDFKNGIGKNNTIPWKNSEDMKHFKNITTGTTIIMGRRTFESIGKPLPNRINIIVSSSEISNVNSVKSLFLQEKYL